MLGDVHDSIRSMFHEALGANETAVVFGPPSMTVTTPDPPALTLWLSDIREEKTGRGSDWEPTRREDGTVSGWRPPLRRYRLAYLVTVVASAYEDEIELMGRLLRSAGGLAGLPDSCRKGWLAEESEPVRVDLACPDHTPAEGWALWSALGVPPRTAITLVVTIPLRSDATEEAAAPVTHRRLAVDGQFFDSVATEVIEPLRRDGDIAVRLRGTVSE